MKLQSHFFEAWSNLISTKLRTFLAILGVLVGTASVVAMVSGGELATRAALAQFKLLGTNLLAVQLSSAAGSTSNQKLPLKTALQIVNNVPQLEVASPYTMIYMPLSYNGHNIEGQIVGVTNNIMNIMKLKMQSGRFISFLDTYESFCVVGQSVYQTIKQSTLKNPIGQQITLGNQFLTIIGVVESVDNNSFMYVDVNNAVFVPIQESLLLNKYTDISNILLRLAPDANIDVVQKKVTDYFSANAPSKQLYFQSAKQLIESMQKQQEILTLFLAFIGSISLLVGGIGVMNIMLVSVTERKREIGIRLAIGAKRRDIQLMFLIEAIVLSLLGGFLGVMIGILISFIIAVARGWGFTLFIVPPLAGFFVSVLTGVFFGFYPAHKAAKLDPIETLRAE